MMITASNQQRSQSLLKSWGSIGDLLKEFLNRSLDYLNGYSTSWIHRKGIPYWWAATFACFNLLRELAPRCHSNVLVF